MDRGFDFGVLCAPAVLVCYAAARFLFALHVEYIVRIYRLVHVFGNIPLVLL
jgi:hypothetical protein